MSAPVKTNLAAEILGGFIQKLMSIGEQAACAYAEAQVPFLALPVVKQIFEWVVGHYGHAIQTVAINFGTSVVIDIQAGGEKSDTVNAATELQLAQASGDQAAIDKAVANARKVYSKGIHWDGTYAVP